MSSACSTRGGIPDGGDRGPERCAYRRRSHPGRASRKIEEQSGRATAARLPQRRWFLKGPPVWRFHVRLPTLPITLQSSVLSSCDICELAAHVCVGNWVAFWRAWASSPRVYSVPSPVSDMVVRIVDWLASECRQSLRFRVDRDWWPRGTAASLSSIGVTVHACVSAEDGRRLLRRTADGPISVEEQAAIAIAYDVSDNGTATGMEKAVAYLNEIMTAVSVGKAGDRLLVVSWE